jgi:hypothetical protein
MEQENIRIVRYAVSPGCRAGPSGRPHAVLPLELEAEAGPPPGLVWSGGSYAPLGSLSGKPSAVCRHRTRRRRSALANIGLAVEEVADRHAQVTSEPITSLVHLEAFGFGPGNAPAVDIGGSAVPCPEAV